MILLLIIGCALFIISAKGWLKYREAKRKNAVTMFDWVRPGPAFMSSRYYPTREYLSQLLLTDIDPDVTTLIDFCGDGDKAMWDDENQYPPIPVTDEEDAKKWRYFLGLNSDEHIDHVTHRYDNLQDYCNKHKIGKSANWGRWLTVLIMGGLVALNMWLAHLFVQIAYGPIWNFVVNFKI